MESKNLIKKLGFLPKENAVGIFQKKYQEHSNYAIEIDFNKEVINYGKLIVSDNKTTQNFSQAENWVVLECVDRLLTKGYKPQNIILEKTWGAGHGSSARLDICVTREDGSEYLLIECKTHGKEFEKAFNRLNKDGGQLFTYFKFSNKPDVIMLYASTLKGQEVTYENHIIKIEEDYRTGDVKDFFDKWNKLTKDNGIFEDWVTPYCFESKALIKSQLKPIRQEDSSFIFNRFLEILRHNVVSDKGNAFNKIFTLFLCKVYDETSSKDDEELKFQWLEGIDDDVKFQLRLTDLYKKGMLKFLSREVSDFDEDDFNKRYKNLSEEDKKTLLFEIHKLRLEKNNEFAIKEVYDHQSFKENAKIVKEVVELLQGYRIRYNKRQQYLSDFFELLLTTGLKQEAGQFFTPVPIAQFIIKSLPLEHIVNEKLKQKDGDLLPFMIDYAAGSGHFITEYMHEVQSLINNKKPQEYIEATAKKIKNWQEDHFDWATTYVYGIEKDYRLVKVGKVGCYLHGDGLANVILSDGLGNFTKTKDYKGRLRKAKEDDSNDNQQFDILLSNPPYSVSAFRQTTREYYTENDFELYDKLTDNSSEIECLFIERTKQLLKDGGIAGIILPSSILSNAGIYTKARELILQYFEVVAIAELGSNTFMATGTNTVVLFLRRRNNYESLNLKKSVNKFFTSFSDVTLNGIEKPVSKYMNYAWEDISFEDYITLLQKEPNQSIQKNDLYKDYRKKIKAKTEKEFWNILLENEKEKLYYFILAYPQKTVIVKTGEKDAEKQFLGYYFSNARGREGIHSMQGSKTIDECTRLFDANSFTNPEKASTYIYQAFNNDFKNPIDETLSKNVSRVILADLLTFDRVEFEKSISLNAKKKLKIESKWDVFKIGQLVDIVRGASPRPIKHFITDSQEGINWIKIGDIDPKSKYIVKTKEKITKVGAEKSRFVNVGDFIISNSMSFGRPYIMKTQGCIHDGWLLMTNFNDALLKDYFYHIVSSGIIQNQFIDAASGGTSVDNLNIEKVSHTKIPLPPLDIQEKIVREIEKIEEQVINAEAQINTYKDSIKDFLSITDDNNIKLENVALLLKRGKSTHYGNSKIQIIKSGQARGYKEFDFSQSHYVDEKFILDERKLEKGDILINSTGVGTAGRVTLFELDGDFVVDSHITILRLNKKVANPTYVLYYLSDVIGFKNIEAMANGQSGQIELSISTIQNIKIPLPELSEQNGIVAEIEKLESQINKAQKIIDSADEIKKEILKKYL